MLPLARMPSPIKKELEKLGISTLLELNAPITSKQLRSMPGLGNGGMDELLDVCISALWDIANLPSTNHEQAEDPNKDCAAVESTRLRDRFAEIALPVLIREEFNLADGLGPNWINEVAADAYRMADAMLKARGGVVA